jgi:hypothetical protein
LPLELALIEAVQGGPVAPVIVQQVVQQVVQAPEPSTGQASGPGTTEQASPAGRGKASGRGGERAGGGREGDDAKSDAPKPEPPVLDAEAARRLHARWKEFLALVKGQCGQQVTAALQAVRDIAVSDQAVALAFGNNEFSRNMVAKPDNLPHVTAILSTFLGRQVVLECQVGEKANLAGRLVNPSAAPSSGPDPLVEFAVNDLGAQIVEG